MEERVKRLLELAARESSGVERERDERAILREFLSEYASRQVSELTPDEVAAVLSRRHEALLIEHEFSPGQLVRWKKGLKNKKRPANGEPAIVLEVLDGPVYDEKQDPGSTYFREPLDIILGVLVENDFVAFYFDKRRFEPYE